MSVIVRDRYPISKLPDDLREGLPDDGWVRVSLEAEDSEADGEELTLEEIFALGQSAPRRTADEIDADLRALRDEWQVRD